jgi:hypothetical protein
MRTALCALALAHALAGCDGTGYHLTGAGGCGAVARIESSGSWTGSTSAGESLHDGSCGAANAPEAVFQLVLVHDAIITLATHGSSFDTVLYVRHGACEGTEVRCDDDGGGGLDSYLNLTLPSGTYFVFVDGYNEYEYGSYVLSVDIDR